MIIEFVKSFIMLFVIMDPFAGIPVFLTLTKNYSLKRKRHSANRAIKVAGLLIVIFIFLGKAILNLFSITLESFEIGGGLILLLLGISYVLDIKFNHKKKHYESDITIPMATPLIAGPGIITSVIILVSLYGYIIPLIAAMLGLLIFWALLYYSNYLHLWMGHQGLEILSRIMGLILSALAVEFIIQGIKTAF